MIDWTKPIETVDGRKARLVETHSENLWHIVYANPDPASCGSKPDVFLVDFEGYRCDNRAIYSKRQEPFIRNARVKRKAWVSLRCIEFAQMADTKDGIESQISQRDRDNGWVACYVEWEE